MGLETRTHSLLDRTLRDGTHFFNEVHGTLAPSHEISNVVQKRYQF